MSIHPKTPEVIQAQVAAFANEQSNRLEHGDPKGVLYQQLGELATGPVEDLEYSIERNKWDPETRNMVPVESRHVVPVAAYLDHLRRIGGSRSDEVITRTPYLQAFQEFEPEVTAVLTKLPTDEVGRLHHETTVGSGMSAIAFPIRHGDKDYIVKVARSDHKGAANADTRLQDLMHGKGITHIEQLAAISYEQGITITERVPGKDMSQITPAEVNQMTEDHIKQGLSTLAEMQAAGLMVDTKTGNVMFSPDTGFGFVDYSLDRHTHGGPQPFGIKANSLLWSIAGVNGSRHLRHSTKDYLDEAEDYKARADALQRFRQACLDLRTTYDLDESLAKANEFIDIESQFVRNVKTPGWVEGQLILSQNRQQFDELARASTGDWE